MGFEPATTGITIRIYLYSLFLIGTAWFVMHCLVSFFLNTIVLALTVNMAPSLMQTRLAGEAVSVGRVFQVATDLGSLQNRRFVIAARATRRLQLLVQAPHLKKGSLKRGS